MPDVFTHLKGSISMSKRLFDLGREIVDADDPPIHRLDNDLYLTAMAIEYLQRTIKLESSGIVLANYFVCPRCRKEMAYDTAMDTFTCRRLCMPVTSQAIISFFGPGIVTPGGQYSTKPPDPEAYQAKLTTKLPRGMDVEKVEKIKEDATQEERPVVMYRAWKLGMPWGNSGLSSDDGHTHDPGGRLLKSINDIVWEPRHPLRAVHWPGGHTHDGQEDHGEGGTPSWYCGCGIYAVKTLVQAQQWNKISRPMSNQAPAHKIQVLGTVTCWGKVLLFETGAKVQYAYPKQLWLSPTQLEWAGETHADRIAEELSSLYGIPVDLEDGMFDLGLSHT